MVIDIYEGLEDLRKGQEKILNQLSTVQHHHETPEIGLKGYTSAGR